MAVIGKIRKHSGLLIGIIGVALAAFILGDISKSQSRRSNNIGEVNGEKIGYKQFSEKVEKLANYEKQRTGKRSLSASESFMIKERTWNNIVNQIILDEEIEKIGIGVSTEELGELVQGNHIHPIVRQNFTDPNTGEFKREDVINLINNFDQLNAETKMQWLQFENSIKQNQTSTKYTNLITKGFYMPNTLAETYSAENLEYASVKLLAKDLSNISDSLISYTESDLKSYYKEHINDFQLQEENRSIEYISFDVLPSAKDRTEISEEVNKIYNDFLTETNPVLFVNRISDERYDSTYIPESSLPVQMAEKFVKGKVGDFVAPYLDNDVYYMAKLVAKQFRPDSMHARHILVAYKNAVNSKETRSKEEAKLLADSLQKVISKNPKKFETLALLFSNDPSVTQNKGDLGWFADGSMVPSFNNAVLNSSVGEVVIADSPFGYHVIDSDGKKGISMKYRVAVISRAIEASEETSQEYYTMASRFATENTDYDSFTKTAEEQGLNKRSFPNMNRMTSFIFGIEYPRQIVQWAFNDEREVGDISEIFEFKDKYVLAILTKIEPKGDRAFDVVRELIELKVKEEKKAEYLINQIKGLNKFEDIASKWDVKAQDTDIHFNTATISSFGREPNIVGKLFAMNNGESDVFKGENTVYFIKLKELKTPETPMNTAVIKTQMESNFINRVYQNGIMRALIDISDIEDNRYLFY